ncbi:C40 family peptidase [Roseibium alexandrii]|uniref:Cell wall-associated hydrolase (Invasion-associated protein) n=1 Tax=Roseibium alexandrii (strain DSM 17067 / NCIMB 14079 / DFL-11) TaxID=244592 RepID=A0A5E8H384_ROSAD|nr:NlpC/P60 family protein [Roseibium alexandrii]EEE46313.2 Cell wall-associated hydrolase (invasion-associated protein) [Roseibium alexandrii DFL-11]
MQTNFDRRRHPVRMDLAAKSYEGQVAADRFVEGEKYRVSADRLEFRPQPRQDISIDTEGLFGEKITVYEQTPEGWAWGQLETDGYVGWFSSDAIQKAEKPTHRVTALRTFLYPAPELKMPPLSLLSIGSLVSVAGEAETRGLQYAVLADGSAIVAKHLVPLGHTDADWVASAEALLGTPYLWGGRSSLGLDCSALVQLAAQTGGILLPRDSDMQEAEAGTEIPFDNVSSLIRGDLLFWKGHVGIITAPNQLLHANGHTMTVAYEELDKAVARIAATEWGAITKARRLG